MPPVRRLCDAGKPRERRDREPHQRRRARARASCDTVGRGACQQDPDIVCANPPVGAATPRPWLLQRAEPRTRAMPACDRASSASAAQPQRTARPPQDCSAPCAVARRRRARAVRRRDALRSRRGRAKVREVWRRRARACAESPGRNLALPSACPLVLLPCFTPRPSSTCKLSRTPPAAQPGSTPSHPQLAAPSAFS